MDSFKPGSSSYCPFPNSDESIDTISSNQENNETTEPVLSDDTNNSEEENEDNNNDDERVHSVVSNNEDPEVIRGRLYLNTGKDSRLVWN